MAPTLTPNPANQPETPSGASTNITPPGPSNKYPFVAAIPPVKT